MDVDYAAVTQLSKRLELAARVVPQRVEKWIHNDVGDALVAAMQQRAPIRTGNLRNSIRKVTEPMRVRVGPFGVDYAIYVSKGTKPHEIAPKNGGVLAFRVNGKLIVTRRPVKHPGTRANSYMEDAAREVMSKMLPRIAGLGVEIKEVERG